MEKLYLLIGERIKQARIELDIKQKDLASEIGINRTSISNIEKGRHQPPLHIIFKICQFLSIEIYSIIPSLEELNRINDDWGNNSITRLIRKDNRLSENSKNNIEALINNLD
ncbi:MAG: helix-turn-helix transcriptional regulator [Bacteroidota bacterium]|nr:helix-turn-helix transcriptional regulator [Bacteroidota bacterium]